MADLLFCALVLMALLLVKLGAWLLPIAGAGAWLVVSLRVDHACSVCGGACELCTRCERPPVLCSCGALQALERCGLCAGLGDRV